LPHHHHEVHGCLGHGHPLRQKNLRPHRPPGRPNHPLRHLQPLLPRPARTTAPIPALRRQHGPPHCQYIPLTTAPHTPPPTPHPHPQPPPPPAPRALPPTPRPLPTPPAPKPPPPIPPTRPRRRRHRIRHTPPRQRSIPIPAPLPHIPRHIIEPPRIR